MPCSSFSLLAVQNATAQQAQPASPIAFGTVNTASTSAPATVTFTFTAPGTGISVEALTIGTKNLDFTDIGSGTCTTNGTTHAYATGDTCTAVLTFTPRFNGPRNGAVRLTGASGNRIALAYVSGIGSGPQIAWLSAPQTQVGFSGPISVAVDGSGNVYVASIGLNAILE